MSSFKLVSGRINRWRVALSTMKRAYLTPPIAVRDPNRISICIICPNSLGSGSGVVFLLFLSIVAVVPISTNGSRSLVEIEKVDCDVDFSSSINVDIFLKPNIRRSWSAVYEVCDGKYDGVLSYVGIASAGRVASALLILLGCGDVILWL